MRATAIHGWQVGIRGGLPAYVWARPQERDPWAALDQRRPGNRAKRERWEADQAHIAAAVAAWRAQHPDATCSDRMAVALARIECFRPPERR